MVLGEARLRLFGKLRHLKAAIRTGKSVKSMHTGLGKTHSLKRSANTLGLYTRVISEDLQLHRHRLQRLEELVDFSNSNNKKL